MLVLEILGLLPVELLMWYSPSKVGSISGPCICAKTSDLLLNHIMKRSELRGFIQWQRNSSRGAFISGLVRGLMCH